MEQVPTQTEIRTHNNILINFNKDANYPEVLFRSNDSIVFRDSDIVYWYLGYDDLKTEDQLKILNSVGAYKVYMNRGTTMTYLRNQPPFESNALVHKLAFYGMLYHGSLKKVFDLRIDLYKFGQSKDDSKVIYHYFTDFGRAIIDEIDKRLIDYNDPRLVEENLVVQEKPKEKKRESFFDRFLGKFFLGDKSELEESPKEPFDWYEDIRQLDLYEIVEIAYNKTIQIPTKNNKMEQLLFKPYACIVYIL